MTGPELVRKRPVTVEAFRYTGDNADEIVAWVQRTRVDDPVYKTDAAVDADGALIIRTLEGDHIATPGDYVVRGIKGEFYPVKPSIFDGTYEPVGEQ